MYNQSNNSPAYNIDTYARRHTKIYIMSTMATAVRVSFKRCFNFAYAHISHRQVTLWSSFGGGSTSTIAKLRFTRCYNTTMQVPYLKASQAADVDKDLMENFSLDVLMELAG